MSGCYGIILLLTGEVKSIPTREQISENIKEQLIVELYSK
jgi:ribosomal protein S4